MLIPLIGSLLLYFLFPIFLPFMRLFPFSYFLAKALPRLTLKQALFAAAALGIFLDMTSEIRFGLSLISLLLTTQIAYSYRRFVWSDKPFDIFLYTSFISFLYSAFLLLMIFLFDTRIEIQGRWVVIDLIVTPWLDALCLMILLEPLVRLWRSLNDARNSD